LNNSIAGQSVDLYISSSSFNREISIQKKKKQRELIDKEKNTLNLSFPKLAKRLNIKPGKLTGSYYDNVLMPEDLFQKFILK